MRSIYATYRLLCCFLVLGLSIPVVSTAQLRSQESIKDLETLFETRQYDKLIHIFRQELQKDPQRSDLYYNLGNCYYHLDSIGHSILNYERALYLNPDDSETRHNLKLAERKAFDGTITEDSSLWSLVDSLTYLMSMKTELYLGGIFFLLFATCMVIFFMGTTAKVKKLWFFIALFSLVQSLFFNALALHQYYYHKVAESEAIVLSFDVNLLDTPSVDGKKLIELSAGTKLTIQEESEAGYRKVLSPTGQTGWVSQTAIERIAPIVESSPVSTL